MNIHKNARLTPIRHEEMARSILAGEQTQAEAAGAYGVSAKAVAKWVRRFTEQGAAGMADRSCRPRQPRAATSPRVIAQVLALRQLRWTGRHIAMEVGISLATASRILRRNGSARLRDLQPRPPTRRYQKEHCGDLIHLDIKQLGRFQRPGHRVAGRGPGRTPPQAGWEYVHVCIDDATRLAYAELFPDQRHHSAVAHLRAAIAFFARFGMHVRQMMTDNGSCYRSRAFAAACRALGIRHIRTRPYTPRTNGKAERFIQTAMREWAYARVYENSSQRARDLPRWTHLYNWHRPHTALGSRLPISRLPIDRNNLLRLHN